MIFMSGWPSSAVTWTRDGHILDSSWEEISPGKSRNTMKLEHLDRDDMDSKLECRGNNNNHTQPVVANIAINMNCAYHSTNIKSLKCRQLISCLLNDRLLDYLKSLHNA